VLDHGVLSFEVKGRASRADVDRAVSGQEIGGGKEVPAKAGSESRMPGIL
jgi:hypothetical protein